MKRTQTAFTLIELLVVIAIIAILSVVVILTLNPASLLQQSRDTNRVSDMASLNSVLGIYLAQGGSSLGSSNVVYVSLPDPTATSTTGDQCQGLGLPTLPGGYTYQCAASSTFRNVNGSGWIPVNFSSLATGAPLSSLPIDPTNTSSSREYYTYTTNGTQYEVTSVMESQKYQLGGSNDVISSDGGTLASVYEKGTKLGLEPLDYGDTSLVGLWNFNEGTGTIAYDSSGSNATGSWSGTMAGTNGYYSAGEIGSWAGAFDGSSTYVSIPYSASINQANFTVSAWVNIMAYNTVAVYYPIGTCGTSGVGSCGAANGWGLGIDGTAGVGIGTGCTEGDIYLADWPAGIVVCSLSNTIPASAWSLITATYNAGNVILYINGVQKGSGTLAITPNTSLVETIGTSNGFHFPGLIDDVRIYNRALTAGQIAALYNGGK